MELAMIGLGAMGERMALRLVRDHRLVVFDLDTAAVERLGTRGAIPATDMKGIEAGLSAPRVVWLMLPAGAPTEGTIQEIAPFLEADDVVVDGGNSHYLDSMRRASSLAEQGIHFLDVGTSGGMAGGERGYSLMIGGPEPIVARLDPIFRSLAADPDHGWGRVGPSGAGHFTKMVHNGIEYALIRAYAQGLTALAAKSSLELDLKTDGITLAVHPGEIQQVVQNYLVNAMQAQPDGGRIEIRSRLVEGGVRVEVRDDGPGFAKEVGEKLFSPFFSTKTPGSGLGLTICAQIIKSHGGVTGATNPPLGGAVFSFILPLPRNAPNT